MIKWSALGLNILSNVVGIGVLAYMVLVGIPGGLQVGASVVPTGALVVPCLVASIGTWLARKDSVILRMVSLAVGLVAGVLAMGAAGIVGIAAIGSAL